MCKTYICNINSCIFKILNLNTTQMSQPDLLMYKNLITMQFQLPAHFSQLQMIIQSMLQ